MADTTPLEDGSEPPLSCEEEETGATDGDSEGAVVTLEAESAAVAEETAVRLVALVVLSTSVDEVAGKALRPDEAAAEDSAAAVEDGSMPLEDADVGTCPSVDRGWQSARHANSATTRQKR